LGVGGQVERQGREQRGARDEVGGETSWGHATESYRRNFGGVEGGSPSAKWRGKEYGDRGVKMQA
jgi:hypothetical protein